jgi:hypothetical protein
MDEQVPINKESRLQSRLLLFQRASMRHRCFTHKGDACYQITACCLTMLTVLSIPHERIN